MNDITVLEINHAAIKPWMGHMKREHIDPKYYPGLRLIGAKTDGRIVGVVGWQPMKNQIRFKVDYVLPGYRGKGIYSKLFYERLQWIREENSGRVKITAFCTELSLPKYLKEGFAYKERKRITYVQREYQIVGDSIQ